MQKRFLEFYVKVILENLLNITLEVADKPDLCCKERNIGIEVTSAEDSKNKEIESLGISLVENKVRDKNAVIEKIKNNGGEYKEFFIVGKPIMHEKQMETFYKVFSNKLKKLNNSEFEKFKENDLCIFSTMHDMEEEECEKIIKKIFDIQKDFKIKFEKVYFILLHSIYTIDTLKKEITKSKMTNRQQYEYAEKANKMMDKI